MNNLSDQVLWNALKKGDLNAFSILFKTYYPGLHNYGLKISNNNVSLTEDCLQDFFLYIYEHRENLADLDTVKPYLFTSFRRSIIHAIKRSNKLVVHEEIKHGEIMFSDEDIMIRQEITFLKKDYVYKLLNDLPYRQKEVLYLRYYSNLQVGEISQVMGINYQSAVNLIHKSIKKLRENASIRKLLKDLL